MNDPIFMTERQAHQAAEARAAAAEAALEDARIALVRLEVCFRGAMRLIENIQWLGNDDAEQCPACLNMKDEGHTDNCELAAVLAGRDGAR